ncbi:hypothetical protein QBC47DRAFT_434690 [Echria macrotheca]|uniref:Uncharacterized protein n=1 Tax=Echria macrotheca TaxID=438768 RepID=A0AAJ0B4J1_9PEZI|nr:hypothetical protein QBC47DRAFT_434690 [Echria macrotheca]
MPRYHRVLSPAASAFSAILSAFIGSVINGLTNGWLVAFMTGWIAWMALFRVLVGGLYMVVRSVTDSWGPGRPPDYVDPAIPMASAGDDNTDPESSSAHLATNTTYQANGMQQPVSSSIWRHRHHPMTKVPKPHFRQLATNIWPSAAVVRGIEQPYPESIPQQPPMYMHPKSSILTPRADLDRNVTFLGWLSLGYTAIFAPITQILFVAANASRHGVGAAKIVKGLTVAVTALPLCVDCRVRYADSLRFGRWACNVVLATSCLLQGGLCAFLLVTGLLDVSRPDEDGPFAGVSTGPPTPIIAAVYVVFSLIWMAASFAILPMRDGGRKGAGKTHWAGYILDIGMGAFAGIFLAVPAFVLYSGATFHSGSDGMTGLSAYLQCERQTWKKFSAVF